MSSLLNRFAGVFQIIFVVAVVGAALMLSASLKPDTAFSPPSAAAKPVAVSVVDPIATPFNPLVELNGVVEARTITSLVPQVAGRVIEVSPLFRPGASVARDDILFVIDPADYELAIERTLAEIEVARSDLATLEAESAAERQVWQGRFPDRPIPDLIARVPQIAAAKARIKSGQAARAAAQLNLDRTTVRAPFDARVLETKLDVGQVVTGTVAVGSIFSIDSLEIAVPVSADELQRIGVAEGRRTTIEPGITGEPAITGTVVRRAASVDERTRLGTLFIRSDEIASLTLGEFVRVTVEGRPVDKAFRLPPAALTSRDRLWVVENGTLADRRVEVLGREANMLIVNAFDYADGVVTIPPSDVRAGLPVEARLGNTARAGAASAAK